MEGWRGIASLTGLKIWTWGARPKNNGGGSNSAFAAA
jgi:hypothetical protein